MELSDRETGNQSDISSGTLGINQVYRFIVKDLKVALALGSITFNEFPMPGTVPS